MKYPKYKFTHFPIYLDSIDPVHVQFITNYFLQYQLCLLFPFSGSCRRPIPFHLSKFRVENSLAQIDCGHLLPHSNDCCCL